MKKRKVPRFGAEVRYVPKDESDPDAMYFDPNPNTSLHYYFFGEIPNGDGRCFLLVNDECYRHTISYLQTRFHTSSFEEI